jgi:argininosuccinate lyase
MEKASPFDIDVANFFDVRRSLAARTAIGAPAPGNVAAQIARWRKLLD